MNGLWRALQFFQTSRPPVQASVFRGAFRVAARTRPAPSSLSFRLRAGLPPRQEFASPLHVRIRPAPDYAVNIERHRLRRTESASPNPLFERDLGNAYQLGGFGRGVGSHFQLVIQCCINVNRKMQLDRRGKTQSRRAAGLATHRAPRMPSHPIVGARAKRERLRMEKSSNWTFSRRQRARQFKGRVSWQAVRGLGCREDYPLRASGASWLATARQMSLS